MSSTPPRIVIIGAGLQGLSVALALAHRGVPSLVIERRPAALCGASHGNEGKLHLGLVYALDDTLETGVEMLRGAHAFAPLLDRWCGPLPWAEWRSEGFRYLVMPDSLASVARLEAYYSRLREALPGALEGLTVAPSYVGTALSWLWRRAQDPAGVPCMQGQRLSAIDTEEVTVDTRLLTGLLAERVRRNPLITMCFNRDVSDVARTDTGYRLSVTHAERVEEIAADAVINCAWSDRIRLDRLAGVDSGGAALCYRVKHRVIVRPRQPLALKPMTLVQGPFGDICPYKDGTYYLSWYPTCRTFFGRQPPRDELVGAETLAAIGAETLAVMAGLFPGLAGAEILSCSPCVIVAKGQSDVDDPDSALHARTRSGPRGGDGWWSVDTGKLTLAPLHGEATARQVLNAYGLA